MLSQRHTGDQPRLGTRPRLGVSRQCDDLVSLALSATSMVVSGADGARRFRPARLSAVVPRPIVPSLPAPRRRRLGRRGREASRPRSDVRHRVGWVTHRSGLHACHWLEIMLLKRGIAANLMCAARLCFCTVASTSLCRPNARLEDMAFGGEPREPSLIWTFPVLGAGAAAFPFAAVHRFARGAVGAALPGVTDAGVLHPTVYVPSPTKWPRSNTRRPPNVED